MFESIKKAGKSLLLSGKKHSPEILIIAGVVASGAALVMACKATLDVQEPLKEAKENVDAVRETKEENDDYGKDIALAYANVAGVVAKAYAIPVALEIASLATIFASNGIQRKRNASLSASLAAIQTMFDRYRANVTEKYGAEEDVNMLYGIHKEKIDTEYTDEETGKTKKKKEEVSTIDSKHINPMDSPFARFFDESSVYWSKSFMQNQEFLRIQQSQINKKLAVNGYLFVNDVFKELDLPQTDIGWDYGWIWDPEKVCQIDFGIYDVYDVAKRNFVNGYERNVLIVLQPDGYIRDKVFPSMTEITSKFKGKKAVKIDTF